jgi:hypothetical protein
VATYNNLIDEAASEPSWNLDVGALLKVHDAAVGGDEFRKTRLSVGGHHNFPAPADVPDLVERALIDATSSTEPVVTTATRLQQRLIAIHPFSDGNGRTARLITTSLLVRAGFRSTLLTAVEQHFHPAPLRYLQVLDQFQYGEINEDLCVAYLLQAMIANAMYAAWFRTREILLRSTCAQLKIPGTLTNETLVAFEFGAIPTGYVDRLSGALAGSICPLRLIGESLTGHQRTELSFQIERLLDEEEAGSEMTQ